MKKHIYRVFSMIILMIGLSVAVPVMAQTNGDPPEPPGQHGQTGNQPAGGGAPIGEGLAILTVLGTAYAGRKWYIKHKQSLAE